MAGAAVGVDGGELFPRNWLSAQAAKEAAMAAEATLPLEALSDDIDDIDDVMGVSAWTDLKVCGLGNHGKWVVSPRGVSQSVSVCRLVGRRF